MEDFAVTCPLVPDASRLISGFCSSPRISDWTSFRPRLATTPLPFSLPSALRKPGHRTRTYELTRHTRRTRETKGRAEGASRLSAGLGPNALLERGNVFLPVLAIELNDFWVFACEVIVIENSDIHSVKIRRSPRSGKDVNATGLAEVMFCDLGPKLICTKVGLARQQAEVIRCDTVMKDALLAADRAVAFGHTINDSFDLESHGTAVAASDVAWHFYGTQHKLDDTASPQPNWPNWPNPNRNPNS